MEVLLELFIAAVLLLCSLGLCLLTVWFINRQTILFNLKLLYVDQAKQRQDFMNYNYNEKEASCPQQNVCPKCHTRLITKGKRTCQTCECGSCASSQLSVNSRGTVDEKKQYCEQPANENSPKREVCRMQCLEKVKNKHQCLTQINCDTPRKSHSPSPCQPRCEQGKSDLFCDPEPDDCCGMGRWFNKTKDDKVKQDKIIPTGTASSTNTQEVTQDSQKKARENVNYDALNNTSEQTSSYKSFNYSNLDESIDPSKVPATASINAKRLPQDGSHDNWKMSEKNNNINCDTLNKTGEHTSDYKNLKSSYQNQKNDTSMLPEKPLCETQESSAISAKKKEQKVYENRSGKASTPRSQERSGRTSKIKTVDQNCVTKLYGSSQKKNFAEQIAAAKTICESKRLSPIALCQVSTREHLARSKSPSRYAYKSGEDVIVQTKMNFRNSVDSLEKILKGLPSRHNKSVYSSSPSPVRGFSPDFHTRNYNSPSVKYSGTSFDLRAISKRDKQREIKSRYDRMYDDICRWVNTTSQYDFTTSSQYDP